MLDPAALVALEAAGSHEDIRVLERLPGLADRHDVGIGEHDGQRCAPAEALACLPCRVVARDLALVARLVLEGKLAVGVAGDEDALVVAGLHRRLDPPRTGVERGFFESQPVERRPTAGEREQLVGLDRRLDAVV